MTSRVIHASITPQLDCCHFVDSDQLLFFPLQAVQNAEAAGKIHHDQITPVQLLASSPFLSNCITYF